MQDASSMQKIDGGRVAKWGQATDDYVRYRPDPPRSMFQRLSAFGIGKLGQRILDLGTGTGALAFGLAETGADVTGTDIESYQIEAARHRAASFKGNIRFAVGSAEMIAEVDQSFQVVTANQCWPYFDRSRALLEIRRVLQHEGSLVVSSFTYLPRHSDVAAMSERLVLQHNPSWTGSNWDGEIPFYPKWIAEAGRLRSMFVYDEDIEFSREEWRGRMRALRAIGPMLSRPAVEEFDRQHAVALAATAAERFQIPHRITAHIISIR